MKKNNYSTADFYAFKLKVLWDFFKSQTFSFWMISGYLFFEFVRPQALIPSLAVIPWGQLLLLGALLGVFFDSGVKWVKAPPNIYIFGFLITIIISTIAAQYPEVSKRNFMQFFGWFVIYFLIINIVNTAERFYLFLLIYIVAAGKIAIGTSKSWAMRGFSFQDWGLMGPQGYFQNSGELAILMLMLFPIAFYMYKYLKDKVGFWEKGLLLVLWICPIMTILGASSRGAQVALAVQLTLIFRKSLFRIKPLLSLVVLITALVILLPQEQKDRFSSAGNDRTSQQRLLYWQHGWEMMKDYPFTGVGYFNFIRYYEAHYARDMLYPEAQLPHNIFIQVGTDAGFIALLFFCLLLGASLLIALQLSKNKNNEEIRIMAAGLGVGVCGFLIAGQFVTVTYYPFFWIHLALLVALNNIAKSTRKNSK